MPSLQRGSVFKLDGGAWAYRLACDEHGRRRQVGGFKTKGDAREACDNHVDRILNPQRRESITLAGLVDEYLAQHVAEQNTLATLSARLKHATKAFGDLPLERLMVAEIAAWRKRLPEGSAWHILKALRQALHYGVAVGLLDENPASKVKNPEPKRKEAQAFGSWAEVEAVAAELSPALRRSRSSRPVPGCALPSGSRSSAVTSTSRRASSTCAACSPTAGSSATASRPVHYGPSRFASECWMRSRPFLRGSIPRCSFPVREALT
jgi:hypothetical protein